MISRGHTEGNSKHLNPHGDKLGTDEKCIQIPLNHQTTYYLLSDPGGLVMLLCVYGLMSKKMFDMIK